MLHRLIPPFRLRARRRPRGRRRLVPARALAAAAVVAALALATVSPARAQTGAPKGHRPPVDAPVADPYRAPDHPFGPGNRGIEYDTAAGDEVWASAEGDVVFAGLVAGDRHVTIRHADGLRTSYSFLAHVDVQLGDHVGPGERLGRAGERLHFGARDGDRYFDPAVLFGADGPAGVELLPMEVPPSSARDEEQAALIQVSLFEGGGGWGISLPSWDDVSGWAADRVSLLQHYLGQLDPTLRGVGLAWDITRRLAFPEPCTDRAPPRRPAATRPGRPRAAILVGGLGSSSQSASIDHLRVDELGYDPNHVVRFSYAGGRTPGTGQALAGIEARPYQSVDTQGDMRVAARRLADLVEAALTALGPSATVDVHAHSMGGVVTRLALDELQRRGVDLGRLGLVTTFGSPHRGADLATAAAAAHNSVGGNLGLDVAAELLVTGLDPDAPAIAQLSETSAVVRELDEAGVPDGIALLSLGARGDIVVTAPNTEVDGARNVTLDQVGWSAHGDMVGSDEATEEVALALAGMPSRCRGAWDVVEGELLSEGISYVEDLGGLALLRAGG